MANYKTKFKKYNGTSWDEFSFKSYDSEKLDGKSPSYYTNYSNLYNKPTIPATNVIPSTTTANKVLLSTSTGGTAAWSSWSSAGFLKTNTSGVVSIDTDTYLSCSGGGSVYGEIILLDEMDTDYYVGISYWSIRFSHEDGTEMLYISNDNDYGYYALTMNGDYNTFAADSFIEDGLMLKDKYQKIPTVTTLYDRGTASSSSSISLPTAANGQSSWSPGLTLTTQMKFQAGDRVRFILTEQQQTNTSSSSMESLCILESFPAQEYYSFGTKYLRICFPTVFHQSYYLVGCEMSSISTSSTTNYFMGTIVAHRATSSSTSTATKLYIKQMFLIRG